MSTILFLVALLVGASAEESAEQALVLTGAAVLDVDQGRILEGYDVILREGRIAGIVPAGAQNDEDDEVLDLSGKVLAPALMDLHSHLLLHPYNETSWNDQVLKESLELRTVRAVAAARRTLEAGFLTLRELGTEGAGYADVALRDAINEGIVPGPRILAATRALVATGCYGPAGFDPRWEVPKGAQVADGPVAVRVAVREQIAAGADWIKVYADYRRRPGDASTPTFSQEELDAIVDEAHTAGLPVAAHASTDEAIRRAVRAGVATIEHGYHASIETLALMRQEGVVLCPTLAASDAISRYRGWQGDEPEPQRVLDARSLLRRALEARVTIACGSDVGVFAHGENVRELELMADYGMPVADVLRAATITAARVLNRDSDLGRIQEGYVADLIVLETNPLEDLTTLRHPLLVIQAGHIVADHR